MENKYFKFLYENLNRPLERRTLIEEPNLGCEALYDLNGNFLISSNEDVKIESGDYLSETLVGKLELIICGGGHIAQAIYKIALILGMNITIIEDREQYCNKELYPEATIRLGKYDEILKSLDLTNSAVVSATRGHKFDKVCVSTVLEMPHKYLGMVGSDNKVATTLKMLTEDINNKVINSTLEELDKLHSPIGLKINAQTPEEIAISILAEVIKVTKENKKEVQMKLDELKEIAALDEPFVVARTIEKKGSAPREAGSYIVIYNKDKSIGTIGGGAIEAVVINDCKKLLNDDSNTAALYYHNLSNKGASRVGMTCGGSVKVIINKFNS